MIRQLITLLFVITFGGVSSATGATITSKGFAGPDAREQRQGLFGTKIYIVEINGEIQRGDADKLAEFVRGLSQDIHAYRIELNSTGGNFSEAIKMALMVHKSYGATYVGPGKHCLSACAIIFMAGNIHNGDGNRVISRTMHVTADVGFHAPFVTGTLPEKVAGELVVRAYEQALKTTSEFLRVSATVDWPNSLTLELLQVPSNEFLRVDTVGRAGRWGFQLEGYNIPFELDQSQAFRICQNHDSWTHERVTRNRDSAALYTVVDDLGTVRKNEAGSLIFSFPAEMGTDCEVIIDRQQGVQVTLDDKVTFFGKVSAWHSFPSDQKLKSLTDETAASEVPKAAALRGEEMNQLTDFGQLTSTWMHNGSVMEMRTRLDGSGTHVSITYKKPRPGISSVGVGPGTLLFSGEIRGGKLQGMARIFRRGCEPAEYTVDSEFQIGQQRDLALKGFGKHWVGRTCQSISYNEYGTKSGVLPFEFVSSQ